MRLEQLSKNLTHSPFLPRLLTGVLIALVAPISLSVLADGTNPNQSLQATHREPLNQPASIHQRIEAPKIQIAILLDTSSSMDGLIDQTRNQLWQVVNEFSTAKQNGLTPVLEVALFEYGNNGNSKSEGFVRRLNRFTRELDKVSEGLFSLTTSGGSEYCGFAIRTAVNSLQWSRSDSDIRTIFIAGNEPFTQGPVDYQEAARLAGLNGISINTIHAGGHQEGIEGGWQSGAMLAGGDYMSIDANQQVVHVVAPQDTKIAELNAQLNETYIPYGSKGVVSAERQREQDAQSSIISAGLLAERAKSKSSSFYSNANWDLVDALSEGEVEEEELVRMEETALPEPMKGLSGREKVEYVLGKAGERRQIKKAISELSVSRDAYVADKKREQEAAVPSMGDALTGAVKEQARQRNFVFEQ